MQAIIKAFRQRAARLRFSHTLWSGMIAQLRIRGRGHRESGAFLLSPREGDGRTVTSVVYYDDLDPNCLQGGIALRGDAYGRLWSICDERNCRVVADVHTHPGSGVGQSQLDRDNPMVARIGHLALIVPWLATRRVVPSDVGVHEYRGNEGWISAFGPGARRLVYVGRWP